MALVEGGRAGRFGPGHYALTALAVGLLIEFARWERHAPEPLLPLRLFANRMFRAAAVSGFLAGMAMFGTISFIPLFVQGVLGGTATEAGSALTPFVLGWVTFSVVSARLLLRIGYRWPVIGGMVCLAVAFLLMSHMGLGTSRAVTARNMLLAGMGMGLIMVPLLLAVQNAVPRTDLGAATSATTFFRSIGGAVGVAVMGAVLSAELGRELTAVLGGLEGPARTQLEALIAHPDALIEPTLRSALPAGGPRRVQPGARERAARSVPRRAGDRLAGPPFGVPGPGGAGPGPGARRQAAGALNPGHAGRASWAIRLAPKA